MKAMNESASMVLVTQLENMVVHGVSCGGGGGSPHNVWTSKNASNHSFKDVSEWMLFSPVL